MPGLMRTVDAWIWPAGLLLVLLAALILAAIMGRIILGPLQRAARRAGQPTQFFLTDFVWLLIQVQATLGLVSAFVERNPAWAFYTVLAFLGCALTAMWWGAVRALSQAGVRGTLRRAVLILVLLPGVEALMVTVIVAGVGGSVVAYRDVRRWLVAADASFWKPLSAGAGSLVLAIGAAMLACWLLRMLTLWLLAEQREPAEATPAP